jgi:hypothetical protein
MERFELRHGKFGPYFYDLAQKKDMSLQDVLDVMNRMETLRWEKCMGKWRENEKWRDLNENQ